MHTKSLTLASVVLFVFALAGCAGDDNTPLPATADAGSDATVAPHDGGGDGSPPEASPDTGSPSDAAGDVTDASEATDSSDAGDAADASDAADSGDAATD